MEDSSSCCEAKESGTFSRTSKADVRSSQCPSQKKSKYLKPQMTLWHLLLLNPNNNRLDVGRDYWRRSWPARSAVEVSVFEHTYTRTTEILWGERGCMAALQVKERASDPACIGFYCFSGHITSRAILIYCAQVHHRWLPFKEDKGQDTANHFKEKDVTAQGGKLLTLHIWVV